MNRTSTQTAGGQSPGTESNEKGKSKADASASGSHGQGFADAGLESGPMGVFVRVYNYPIPRVKRMMLVAREMGYEPLFLGAFRETGLSRTEVREGWKVERVGSHFPLVNGTKPLLYLFSMLKFGFALLMRLLDLRPAFVHVSDFEPYWPTRIFAWLTRTPLIYNIHDNLAQRYQCPEFVAKCLNLMEGLAVLSSSATLVPEDFRRTALPRWCQHKVRIIRNTPVDPGYSAPEPCKPDHKTTIFYAGWLDSGRGLYQTLDMIEKEEGLQLNAAGSGDEAIVASISEKDRVTWQGYLLYEQAMQSTVNSDFVVALYDPRRPINVFAASNKIAEALAVGRPPIINREMKIAELLEANDCAVLVDYDDAADAAAEIVELRHDFKRYSAMCRRAREVYESHYAWDKIRAATQAAYETVGVPSLGPDEPRAAS